MSDLNNMRWEQFAQNIAKGMNAGPAYTAAGYTASGHSADVGASRLLNNDDIKARISELLRPALADAEVTVERVIRELAYIAFYDPTDMFEPDRGELQIRDLRFIPEDLRQSLVRFKPVQIGNEIRYEAQFADKLRALELLARYLQMFKEGIRGDSVLQIIQEMSDDEIDRRITELEKTSKAA